VSPGPWPNAIPSPLHPPGRGSVVVRGFVPLDIAAAGGRRSNGDAGLDGDLVGVGSDADLDGLPRVDQSDLDLLAADHDRSADGERRATMRGSGRRGGWAVPAGLRAAGAGPRAGRGRRECGPGHRSCRSLPRSKLIVGDSASGDA